MIDEESAADAGDVAEDDEDGEPEGEVLAPAGEAEGDDGGEEQQFVCEGVEDGAEAAFLIEVACDIAVDGVADGGDGEDGDGGPAEGFVGVAVGYAVPVVDGHGDEDGDQQDAEEGDLGGVGHGEAGGGSVAQDGGDCQLGDWGWGAALLQVKLWGDWKLGDWVWGAALWQVRLRGGLETWGLGVEDEQIGDWTHKEG